MRSEHVFEPMSGPCSNRGFSGLVCLALGLSLGLSLALACLSPSQPVAEAAASQPAAAPVAPPPPPPPALEELHLGLDVSVHSGEVDWSTVVVEGHTFAFVKATEGVDLKDPSFDLHWQAMRQAGIRRGAYHFYVTEDDPEEQAKFFIENVDLEPGDLVPVVDLELIGHGTPDGLADRFRIFLARIEEHFGVKPIIYTSAKFWDRHVGEGFGDYPLWVAEYEVSEPRLPVGWQAWHLWQWRADAPIAGVQLGADLSRVNRSGVDLAVLTIPERPSS